MIKFYLVLAEIFRHVYLPLLNLPTWREPPTCHGLFQILAAVG